MRKTVTFPAAWLAASSRVPLGSMWKLRGVAMVRFSWPTRVRRPDSGVDAEDHHAVVAPVRAVEQTAVGVDVDVGGGEAPAVGDLGGDGRHRLDRGQQAPLGVVAVARHGEGALVDHVGEAAAGVKVHVPGARPAGRSQPVRLVGLELSVAGVEAELGHVGPALAGHEHEPVARDRP